MYGDDSGRIYVILMQLTHSMTAHAKAPDHKSQENAAPLKAWLHFLIDEFFFKIGLVLVCVCPQIANKLEIKFLYIPRWGILTSETIESNIGLIFITCSYNAAGCNCRLIK